MMFGSRDCQSLEEAAARPQAVRRLQLNHLGECIETFAELLPHLTNAKEIQVGWQEWTRLPEGLARLPQLKRLTVLNTPIRDFPEFLSVSPRLQCLILRGTDIDGIPPTIRQMRGLRQLDFSNNPTSHIPAEVGHLEGLRDLQLADLGLGTLPGTLAALRHLRFLGLAGNQFSSAEASKIKSWYGRAVRIAVSGS